MFAVFRNKTFGTFLREFSPPITSILLNAVGSVAVFDKGKKHLEQNPRNRQLRIFPAPSEIFMMLCLTLEDETRSAAELAAPHG